MAVSQKGPEPKKPGEAEKAPEPFSIASTILTITDVNMKERVLADVLKRVGVTDFWKDVGKQAAMKIFLEKTAEQEATAEAQSRLNKLMDDRNQIAHPTAATQFPDPDQVLKSAAFLLSLAEVTVNLAKVYMAGFQPPVVAAAPAVVAPPAA